MSCNWCIQGLEYILVGPEDAAPDDNDVNQDYSGTTPQISSELKDEADK